MTMPFTHHETVEGRSRIVRAAFTLAQKAHGRESGQMRGKGGLPYLVHPIMLYDLLVHFGETDELTLACALLHDAKEDYPAYKNDPEALKHDLVVALIKEGVRDAEHIAYTMDEICNELTNHSFMEEGKRTWQVEHAGKISERAAKIKLFDQMASIVDNILMPDDPDCEQGGVKWSRKAMDVVKSIYRERQHKFDFSRALFKVLCWYNLSIIKATDEEAAKLRQDFDWDKAVRDAEDMLKHREPDALIVATLRQERSQEMTQGVLQVGFDETGKIAGYAVLVNPQEGKQDPRNDVAIDMMGCLEETEMKRRVSVWHRETMDGRIVRKCRIRPPIEAEQFCRIGKQEKAVGFGFAIKVKELAGKLARDNAPMRALPAPDSSNTQSDRPCRGR